MSNEKPKAGERFVRGNPQGNTLARRSLFVVAGLGLMVLVALVQFGENGIFAFFKLQAREAELQEEVTELESRSVNLELQLNALANDPEALEKLARENHNMRRSDEEVLLVLPKTTDN